jgi:hypothetical protein
MLMVSRLFATESGSFDNTLITKLNNVDYKPMLTKNVYLTWNSNLSETLSQLVELFKDSFYQDKDNIIMWRLSIIKTEKAKNNNKCAISKKKYETLSYKHEELVAYIQQWRKTLADFNTMELQPIAQYLSKLEAIAKDFAFKLSDKYSPADEEQVVVNDAEKYLLKSLEYLRTTGALQAKVIYINKSREELLNILDDINYDPSSERKKYGD